MTTDRFDETFKIIKKQPKEDGISMLVAKSSLHIRMKLTKLLTVQIIIIAIFVLAGF